MIAVNLWLVWIIFIQNAFTGDEVYKRKLRYFSLINRWFLNEYLVTVLSDAIKSSTLQINGIYWKKIITKML